MEREQTNQKNPEGERLFQSLFNAAPIGIAVEDLEGRPLFANPALCSMLGFTEEELRSKHCVEFSPPEDASKDWAFFEQLRQGSINNYQLDKRFFRKDGTVIWGRLSISLMENPVGSTWLVVAMVEDISEKKVGEEALQRLSARLIQTQEEERRRISRELHDDVSQQLALLSSEIQLVKQTSPISAKELWNRMDELQKRTSEIAIGVHFLSHELHSSKLEYLGVVSAMKGFCREFGDKHTVNVDFQSEGVPPDLRPEISLCLFRVLQESLRNALKHSGVRFFEAKLHGSPAEIRLTVRDSGVGFEPEAARDAEGLGLISMEERVRLVNGTILLTSQPGSGTEISVRVPLSTGKPGEQQTQAAGA